MSERRLLCVYQHAPTRGAGGVYRHRLYLGELVRRGWHVDLVSTPINYMTGEAPEAYRGRAYFHEVIDGIDHHWVWASGRIQASRPRRAANYLTFTLSSAARGLTLPRPSIVWASSPPLFVATVGATLARRFGRPWVYEVRDLWPESAASVGWLSESSPIYRALERMAYHYAASADAVIVPTQGLVEDVRRHGAREVTVLTGAVLDRGRSDEAAGAYRSSLGLSAEACVFVYTGALGVANGLDTVLDAAKLLQASGDERIRFVLAGDGSDGDRIRRRAADERLANVDLLGMVQQDEVWDVMAAGDVGLHCLRPSPLFAGAQPTKMLDYMSVHRPTLTTVDGLPRALAIESGGGFAATPEELAAEARRWAAMSPDELRRRGEESFRFGAARFGLEPIIDRLEEVLADAIGAHAARAG